MGRATMVTAGGYAEAAAAAGRTPGQFDITD